MKKAELAQIERLLKKCQKEAPCKYGGCVGCRCEFYLGDDHNCAIERVMEGIPVEIHAED